MEYLTYTIVSALVQQTLNKMSKTLLYYSPTLVQTHHVELSSTLKVSVRYASWHLVSSVSLLRGLDSIGVGPLSQSRQQREPQLNLLFGSRSFASFALLRR